VVRTKEEEYKCEMDFDGPYPGAELPRDQVALLKPTVGVQVVAIKGDKAYSVKTAQPVGYLEVEMALRPGDHKIELMLNHGDVWSRGTTILNLKADAGRKYLINYTMLQRSDLGAQESKT